MTSQKCARNFLLLPQHTNSIIMIFFYIFKKGGFPLPPPPPPSSSTLQPFNPSTLQTQFSQTIPAIPFLHTPALTQTPPPPQKKTPKKTPLLNLFADNMLRIYLFACYLIAIAHASPVAYSDKNLMDIDRLRASGASEVFYFFPFHLLLCPLGGRFWFHPKHFTHNIP